MKLTPLQEYYAERGKEWPFDLAGYSSHGERSAKPKDYVFLARAVHEIGAALYPDFQANGIICLARFEDVIAEMREAAALGNLTLVYLIGDRALPIRPSRWQSNNREPHKWKIYFASCETEHETQDLWGRHERYPIFVEKQSLKSFLGMPSGEAALLCTEAETVSAPVPETASAPARGSEYTFRIVEVLARTVEHLRKADKKARTQKLAERMVRQILRELKVQPSMSDRQITEAARMARAEVGEN
jgi:hypothetical protein